MSFEDEFPIGCEVLCVDHEVHIGAVGVVVKHNEDTIRVEFYQERHPNPRSAFPTGKKQYHNLFPRRFIRTDGVRMTPVIRKIRQMEQRRRAA
jgi:hypothetical protein